MSTAPFTSDPLIDAHLGNYRIIRSLGMGGMGKVYVAHDETLKRPVAIKVIHEQFRAREDYQARLMREASAIANLKHPNIVQIYTAGEQDGILYFAMELLSGRNLKDLLNENLAAGGGINFDAVIQIGTAVAAALDYAHEKGVIHRDLKPANVIITHENHVYLTDFGLALDVRDVSQEHTPKEGGTPHYMSPEQIEPQGPVGPASDQYALGVMLFEMLTGTVPFEGEDPESIYQKHLHNPPPKPLSLNRKLTPEIQDILLRALAKNPAERYENCTTLMRLLAEAWKIAQETRPPQFIPLPSLPAGTRAKHGLPTEKREAPTDRKTRPVDLPPDTRVAEPRTPDVRPAEVTRPRTYENTRPRTLTPYPPLQKPRPSRRSDRLIWTGVGAIGGALILIAFFFGLQYLSNNPLLASKPTPTPTMTASPTVQPSPTATFPSIALPTSTSTPTEPLPAPSPSPTLTPTPTPLTGDSFLLLYDDTSFNLLNLSTRARDITLLSFERIDFAGETLEIFRGQQWARFNDTIRPNTCMRIKLSTAPNPTSPEECSNIFDAEVTISPTNQADFWTIRPNSSQFLVLWSEVEIARCFTISRRCEILIP